MSVFNEYARYYDLLYRDKDYAGETDYVDGMIQSHALGARTILNLGCGSGRHDRELIKKGYQVTGVDSSTVMLDAAKSAANDIADLDYVQGDIRSIRLEKTFDAVVSLFHVMSYQTSNDDLLAAFETARTHLKPGGIFIFDCWYGPGVLSDKPTVRIKEMEDEYLQVTRIAQPTLETNSSTVEVGYRIFVNNKNTGTATELKESHLMRYLFQPEIYLFSKLSKLSLIDSFDWLSQKAPDSSTWYAFFVCRAL